jgi:hypothetical protein
VTRASQSSTCHALTASRLALWRSSFWHAGVTLFAVPTALGAETKHLPALAKSEEDFRLHYAPIAGWQLYNGMFDSKHTCKNVLLCALAEHCRSAISLATVTMAYERSARMMVVQDCATRNYIQKFKHQYIVLGA